MILYHNGAFKDAAEPLLPISDRGLRYGDGVFDTLRVENGLPLHVDKHFARLMSHAQVLGLSPAFVRQHETHKDNQNRTDFEEIWTKALADLVTQNAAHNGVYALNTYITRGSGSRGLAIPAQVHPEIILVLSPLPTTYPLLRAIVSRSVRRAEHSPLSCIKSMTYTDSILALREAQAKGANEAIFLNHAGNVACTSTGNIIVELDGNQRFTPPLSAGVVDGITRGLLLAQGQLHERTLTLEDLMHATRLFMCNSLRGVVAMELL